MSWDTRIAYEMQWHNFKIGDQIHNRKKTTRNEMFSTILVMSIPQSNCYVNIFIFFFFSISPNLKAIIYCTAISYGSEEEWDFAWKMYKMTTVASEKDLILDALGCSRETWILARLLKNANTCTLA